MISNRSLVLVFPLLAVTACAEPTVQPPKPGMELARSTLLLSAERGRGIFQPSEVRISNPGTAPLHWSSSAPVYWLSTNPGSGVVEPGGSAEFTVIVNPGGKEVGEYAETLTFTAAGAPELTRTLDVVLTITEPPVLEVSTTSLFFTAAAGEASPPQRVTVSNAGGGVFSWQMIISNSWLAVRPAVGTLAAGDSREIEVTASGEGLAPGNYTGFVAVSAPTVPATGMVVVVLTVQ